MPLILPWSCVRAPPIISMQACHGDLVQASWSLRMGEWASAWSTPITPCSHRAWELPIVRRAKWAIRSGFGIFYAQDIGNAVYDMSRNLAVRRNVTGRSPYPNLTLENPFAVTPGDDGLTVTAPTILSNWVPPSGPV